MATEPQPIRAPSITAEVSAPRATSTSTWPTGSTRRAPLRFGFRDKPGRQADGDESNGQIHPEDRAPAETARERSADDRPNRQGQPGHRAPHPDGPRTGFGLLERVGDDRERHRVEHGCADSLESTERDQVADARSQAAEQRTEGENRHPHLENTPPPETVRHGTRQDQKAGDHERVGIDHPLQADEGGMEIVLEWRATTR